MRSKRGCEKIDNVPEFKNNLEFRVFAISSQPLRQQNA
jgi:hypothetical protein